jgi:hypothetical protein
MQPFARCRHQTRQIPEHASAAMTRLLLATCLLLCASAAFAKSPAAAEDPADGSAKPGKAATVTTTSEADPAAPAHPLTAPSRSAPLPTRGGAPRWHSLLPGMIR